MKCRHCSKNIPDGFADCPWCGESYAPDVLAGFNVTAAPPPFPSPTAARSPAAALKPTFVPSATHPAIVWVVFALSFVVVALAAFVATVGNFGDFSMRNTAFFLGALAGPYIVSAVIVLAFYFLSKKKAHDSTKLFAAFCGASILAVLSLLGSRNLARPLPHAATASSAQPAVAKTLHPHTPTVWDPAVNSVFTDIKSTNDAYLAEISQLDLDAHPLYVASSFRDTHTIQQVLAQLDDRNAIAEKYSSWDPIVAKVPVYVASANASDNDKRKFLASFTPVVQQMVDQRDAASRIEREWLRYTIELYHFMLSHQGTYTISADGQQGTFVQPALRDQFNAKLQRAAKLKQQFIQASATFQATQRAVRTQMGMEP